ncbi:hypothetical protein BCR44DRAFT_1009757 [Catenaria anguillulae PL171]|uniref:Uncharacterized protein n=1 Tax=Catenaria anguillulae PL171 TaxID=765915 RepID=A0A1Y2I5I3_9FUNG|nr:hypothetical protein BCR44DRAFT_1009757 [Catenaria anguillulae PL171]
MAMSNPSSPSRLDGHLHLHDDRFQPLSTDHHQDMMDIDESQPTQGLSGEPDGLEEHAGLHQEQVTDAEIEDLIANAKTVSEDALAILDSLKSGRSPDQAEQGTLNVALMLHSLNEALESAEPRPNDLSLLQFVDYSFPFYEMTPETARADLAELQKAVELMGDQAHDHQAYVKYLTAIMDKDNPEWVNQDEAKEIEMACAEYEQVIEMHVNEVKLKGSDISELALEIENGERSLHAAVAQLSDLIAIYNSFPDPFAVYPDSTIDEQDALLQKMHHELAEINASLSDLEPAMAAGPETLADLDRELAQLEAENACSSKRPWPRTRHCTRSSTCTAA